MLQNQNVAVVQNFISASAEIKLCYPQGPILCTSNSYKRGDCTDKMKGGNCILKLLFVPVNPSTGNVFSCHSLLLCSVPLYD